MLLAKESRIKYDWKVKLFFAAFFLWAIYKSISNVESQTNVQIFNAFRSFKHIQLLMLVLVLMPLNWFFEAYKWQILMQAKENKFELVKSLKSVLIGISIGLITPLRLGEYYGRTLVIGSNQLSHSLFSTFVCSLLQNIVTFFVGIIGILFFLNYSNIYESSIFFTVLTSSLFLLVGLGLLFRLDLAIKFLGKIPFIKDQVKGIKIESISSITKGKLILVTGVRYTIYFFQYVLLMYFFNVDTEFSFILMGVSSIFLIQSMLPLPPFLGLLARAELALLIWSTFEINYVVILSVTFLLWFINLVLPAMIGLYMTLKLKPNVES